MTEDKARTLLGQRVKEARSYLSLSQEEVAKAIGVPRSAISKIEDGSRGIDALELPKLAKVLGRNVEYLTGGADIPTKDEKVALLARAVDGLSDGDIGELQRFAAYLKSRSGSTSK